jgi:hypothetical protein
MTNGDYLIAVLEGRPIPKRDLLELRRINVAHDRRELFAARRLLLVLHVRCWIWSILSRFGDKRAGRKARYFGSYLSDVRGVIEHLKDSLARSKKSGVPFGGITDAKLHPLWRLLLSKRPARGYDGWLPESDQFRDG